MPEGIRFSARISRGGGAHAHIMSLNREKTLYIDVAVFGKKCYTNVRRTSNHSF